MSELKIHTASKGYQSTTAAYENGRPAYTEESVFGLAEKMNLQPTDRIVELGAGTGKFTRILVQRYPDVVAVEPVESMREKLVSLLPAVTALQGTGENIPVPDASADAIIVANAFHWFDGDMALREIHRALKPGGGLGLIWNIDGVFTSTWGQQIDAWLDELEGDTPQYKTGKWRNAFERTQLFSPIEEHRYSSIRKTTPSEVVDRVASISFIASLPEQSYRAFRSKVESWLSSHPDSQSKEYLAVSLDTKIYWCFKR
jgi:SAM-dependent methyltransferase